MSVTVEGMGVRLLRLGGGDYRRVNMIQACSFPAKL